MINDVFNLQGRNALITGGGTGLGRHFATVLAAAGARVVLCARRLDKIRDTAEEIMAGGGQAAAIPMDVTEAASVSAAFEQAAAQGPVTVLVNNAGVVSHPSLLAVSEEEWDQVLATNLKGAWLVAREAVRRLAEQPAAGGGAIINIASILGTTAQKGTGPYSASKAALLQLTRNMALEWARHQVRVNAIAPGYYSSDLADDFLVSDSGRAMLNRIPQRRLGELQDLTGAILLLASDASRYMTGSVVTVDGGHSIPVI